MRVRTWWAASMEKHLMEAVLKQVQKGNWKHGFKKASWAEILGQVNTHFENDGQLGDPFTLTQVKTKEVRLRRDFQILESLLAAPGFEWDPESATIVASHEAWAAHLATRRDREIAAKYRNKKFPNFDTMEILFHAIEAVNSRVGQLAGVNDSVVLEEEEEAEEEDWELDSQSGMDIGNLTQDSPEMGAVATPSMDQMLQWRAVRKNPDVISGPTPTRGFLDISKSGSSSKTQNPLIRTRIAVMYGDEGSDAEGLEHRRKRVRRDETQDQAQDTSASPFPELHDQTLPQRIHEPELCKEELAIAKMLALYAGTNNKLTDNQIAKLVLCLQDRKNAIGFLAIVSLEGVRNSWVSLQLSKK
ncbi:hypothetical protein L873DRAFT_1820513 [Choiromyces venosus 120613-1]|uniref:Myb/SANT-like domain-containing protein n=1 Tax=Choiromyces venosus 120613-1 TaxID=1336337 RepID=A0A3N4J0P1_9PEZI|nr:hypothetical protein L873DRAFT_1820513 [Choiromyces venosus 120613-1]